MASIKYFCSTEKSLVSSMYKHTTHTVPVIKTILSINSSYREYDEVKYKTQNFPIFIEYDEV